MNGPKAITLKAPLSDTERQTLTGLEMVIKNGLQNFINVGLALSSIRDQRLYRENFKSFEQYLWEKWQFSKAHGYRLLTAASIIEQAKKMSPMGDTVSLPTSERAIRPLVKLPVAQHGRVLSKANELAAGNDITGEHIKKAIIQLGYSAVLQANATGLKRNDPDEWLKKLEHFAVTNDLPDAVELVRQLREVFNIPATTNRAAGATRFTKKATGGQK